MPSQADKLLADLPRMSRSDLQQVWARAQALLGSSPPPTNRKHLDDGPVRELYHELVQVMAEGKLRMPPFPVFTKMTLYPIYREGAPIFLEYIDENFKGVKKTERMRLTRILLRAIIFHVRAIPSIPISPTTIIRRIGEVSPIIDRQFPGYREAGLLKLLLRMNPRT